MAKLIVEVLNARDLLSSNNHHGSASPFVEVDFDGQRQRTQTKTRDLYPTWNEKLVVDIHDPRNLPDSLIQVMLYDDRYATPDLLGCVQISGSSVSLLESEAAVERYPLCKRGFFAHGRGDISLRIYTVRAQSYGIIRQRRLDFKKRKVPKLEEITHHGGNEKTAGEVQVQFPDQAHLKLKDTRPNVCVAPPLYLLRVFVIEARDLAPFYRTPALQIWLELGNQMFRTTTAKLVDGNPVWNEDIYFIASQEMSDGNFLIINAISINEKSYTTQKVIGKVAVPISGIPHTLDSADDLQPQWYNLNGVSSCKEEGRNGKDKVAQVLIKLCFVTRVHISDISVKHSYLAADHLMKDSVGSLELAVLSARDLPPMNTNDGTAMPDAYCVVKYGKIWIRTKTIINSQEPCWNEKYVFKVYDPCTTVMIGLFHNSSYTNSIRYTKDPEIGKVLIPIQTLEVNRLYTCYYPLLVLGPSGLRNHGELQVAVRFTGVTWTSMLSLYTKFNVASLSQRPRYTISYIQMEILHRRAVQIVSAYLSKAEPPIKKETVEYMLDVGSLMWSLRKQKAHFERLMSLVFGITAVHRWLDEVCRWRNPLKTVFILFLYMGFVWYPKLILPTFFLSLSMIGMWNYRHRPINPPHLDAHLSHAENTDLDILDEEFDTFPTSRPVDKVKTRYDQLRRIAGRYQTVFGDIATLGEKVMAILTCADIKATSMFTIISFVGVVFIYMASFKVAATLLGLYWLRHPWLRSKKPSLLVYLLSRLPSKMDMFLLT